MNYSAISIQGNIITSEILEKIRTEDTRFQKAVDFNLNPGASVRDEINLAWSVALSNWNAFKMKRDALKETDSGTSETRKYWLLPLLALLGYDVDSSNAEIINGKSYAISHRASNRDGFPLHLVGAHQSLDKRPETGGTRLSPHALVQEYVNNIEHLYAIVSNGRFLRLLRDATRLSRLSYLEFDLEQIMEEGLYVEFALLYRTLHATRMSEKMDGGAESIMEFYHQEAIASGSRIRERLSIAVESSIKELANGLLRHPQNEELRKLVLDQKIEPKDYYLHTLRLVYRMLFLLVIEERKLIYTEKRNEELNKKRDIYYNYYSIQRLTKLAVKTTYIDPRKTDLWHSLLATFSLFEESAYGKKLGIEPLGSGLFSTDALGAIKHQMLDNECLLKVIRYLVTFENENGQTVHVNYADLDVEEFGSIYEGLLEYDPIFTDNLGQPIFSFVKGDARSSSGSHYTPEELVKPLITHSLDYLIEDRLKEADPEAALLSLTICDVACGSGHILLSAARRVGFELARVRSNEDQPTPTAMRAATRDVIRNCIYGVDLNPLAVELCKVALWLEAHQPGEPLNFLDHHIKCGNAIVGLAHRKELENGIANEAFKTLPEDDKTIAKIFRDQNIKERKIRNAEGVQTKVDFEKTTSDSVHEAMAEYKTFSQQPETTPEEIARKARAYQKFIDGKGYSFLKAMADAQVAQFFIPKTTANKDQLMTDAEYRMILTGHQVWQNRKIAKAMAIAHDRHIFHWFLEFPEVFQNEGFDCILGNPPYLGGRKISSFNGSNLLNYLFSNYKGSQGQTDLIAYFYRRIFKVINSNGFQSLISTETICKGDTRVSSLEFIIEAGGVINFAIKSLKWPGKAAVQISLNTITKRTNVVRLLDGVKVEYINSYFSQGIEAKPFLLKINENDIYKGTDILGTGFCIEEEFALNTITKDEKYKKILYPYLTGEDLNNNPIHSPSRWIINFFDWELKRTKEYEICYNIIKENVKPERDNNNREIYKRLWWQFGEKRIGLYDKIENMDYCLIGAAATKHLTLVKHPTNIVFSNRLYIVTKVISISFPFLQSIFHEAWSWQYGAKQGGSTLSYSTKDCFETFPFPQNLSPAQEANLEEIGEQYHEHRRQLMLNMQLGLTKTYNAFHAQEIKEQRLKNKDLESLDKKTIEKQFGKEVWYLWNHLQKTENVCTFEEAVAGIVELRRLHVLMDNAVLEAYGWSFDTAQLPAIKLRHDFYEVDYLPENDRIRYTIHPDARKEVLKRLLELNHKIHDEEVKAGLWDKKKNVGKKSKKTLSVVSEPEVGYGGLFDAVE